MVRLFFAGLSVFVLVVVGVFSAVLTPLMAGISNNLGGSPHMPVHSPIPQPVLDMVSGLTAHVTPALVYTATLGVAALLAIYTVGACIGYHLNRHDAKRRRWSELRFRARMIAARHQRSAPVVVPTAEAERASEIENLWK